MDYFEISKQLEEILNESVQEVNKWQANKKEMLNEKIERLKTASLAFIENNRGKFIPSRMLSEVEYDFLRTAYLVKSAGVKAYEQAALAIDLFDREAIQQAFHFIDIVTGWFISVELELDLVEVGWGIRDLVEEPQLIYWEKIRR